MDGPLDYEHRTLDFRLWNLDFRLQTMDFGVRSLDSRVWSSEFGLRTRRGGEEWLVLFGFLYSYLSTDLVTIDCVSRKLMSRNVLKEHLLESIEARPV